MNDRQQNFEKIEHQHRAPWLVRHACGQYAYARQRARQVSGNQRDGLLSLAQAVVHVCPPSRRRGRRRRGRRRPRVGVRLPAVLLLLWLQRRQLLLRTLSAAAAAAAAAARGCCCCCCCCGGAKDLPHPLHATPGRKEDCASDAQVIANQQRPHPRPIWRWDALGCGGGGRGQQHANNIDGQHRGANNSE